ncbi:PIN domain-containing protein [Paenibacillus terrae]|uniref:DUF4935 domain-containing protein n=1 Tax=Paenibacillus terrae TaxID=159743 RepID=A0A0D7X0R8_9BACL|nr:PIN domain-containing protein [Paenibacillus terrae]KJD43602.1 hypothetical protein QD47_21640 [Paenibacillus terrae]
MNIFLDTTVLYRDPFLSQNLGSGLVKAARNRELRIYISEVVLEEAKRHYLRKVETPIVQLRKAIKDYNSVSLLPEIPIVLPELNEVAERFEAYYNELMMSNIVKIVPYDNNLLPELVHRSINRIKPFTDKKQEFRDGIIWLSYARLAETEDLTNCFFITNNTSDYFSGKRGGELHPDLKKDSKRFSLFKSLESLMFTDMYKEKEQNLQLIQWIENNDLDTDKLLELLEPFHNDFCEEASIYVNELSLEDAVGVYIPYGSVKLGFLGV